MVQINFALKEVNCKVVYYGPGMSGKTTNLEKIHEKTPKTNAGELTSIATEGDRTLFFDFMPLDLGTIAGMKTKFQIYTVPGQVYYNSTRKIVLQGADGVIFVGDSQPDKIEENRESLNNLKDNLAEHGLQMGDIPVVIQWNKQDLPGALTPEVLDEKLNEWGFPSVPASAYTGEGVFPTLKKMSQLVIAKLNEDQGRKGGIRKAPPRPKPAGTEEGGATAGQPAQNPSEAKAKKLSASEILKQRMRAKGAESEGEADGGAQASPSEKPAVAAAAVEERATAPKPAEAVAEKPAERPAEKAASPKPVERVEKRPQEKPAERPVKRAQPERAPVERSQEKPKPRPQPAPRHEEAKSKAGLIIAVILAVAIVGAAVAYLMMK